MILWFLKEKLGLWYWLLSYDNLKIVIINDINIIQIQLFTFYYKSPIVVPKFK